MATVALPTEDESLYEGHYSLIHRDRWLKGHGDIDIEEASITMVNVYVRGNHVELQEDEYKLLSILVTRPHFVFHHDELCQRLAVNHGGLANVASRLRQKIGLGYVAGVRGVGYRLLYG